MNVEISLSKATLNKAAVLSLLVFAYQLYLPGDFYTKVWVMRQKDVICM